jgi:hypothetical protein
MYYSPTVLVSVLRIRIATRSQNSDGCSETEIIDTTIDSTEQVQYVGLMRETERFFEEFCFCNQKANMIDVCVILYIKVRSSCYRQQTSSRHLQIF